MRERQLSSGANWQGTLKQKGVKQECVYFIQYRTIMVHILNKLLIERAEYSELFWQSMFFRSGGGGMEEGTGAETRFHTHTDSG